VWWWWWCRSTRGSLGFRVQTWGERLGQNMAPVCQQQQGTALAAFFQGRWPLMCLQQLQELACLWARDWSERGPAECCESTHEGTANELGSLLLRSDAVIYGKVSYILYSLLKVRIGDAHLRWARLCRALLLCSGAVTQKEFASRNTACLKFTTDRA